MNKPCLAISVHQDRLYWCTATKSSMKNGSFALLEMDQSKLEALVPPKTRIVFVASHPYEHVECLVLPSQQEHEISTIIAHQIKSQHLTPNLIHWEWVLGCSKASHQQVVGVMTSQQHYIQTNTSDYSKLHWDVACSELHGLLLALTINPHHQGLHMHFSQNKILFLALKDGGFENFRYFYASNLLPKELISEIMFFYKWQAPETLDIQFSGDPPDLTTIYELTKAFNGKVKPWAMPQMDSSFSPIYIPLLGVCHAALRREELPQYQIRNQAQERYVEKNFSLWCWASLALLFLLCSLVFTSMLRKNVKENYANELYNALKKHYSSTLTPGKPSHFSEVSFVKTLEKQALRDKGAATYGTAISQVIAQLQKTLIQGPDFQLQELRCSPAQKKFSLQGTVADLSAYEELDQRLKQNKKWNVMSNFTRTASSKKTDLRLQVDIKEMP